MHQHKEYYSTNTAANTCTIILHSMHHSVFLAMLCSVESLKGNTIQDGISQEKELVFRSHHLPFFFLHKGEDIHFSIDKKLSPLLSLAFCCGSGHQGCTLTFGTHIYQENSCPATQASQIWLAVVISVFSLLLLAGAKVTAVSSVTMTLLGTDPEQPVTILSNGWVQMSTNNMIKPFTLLNKMTESKLDIQFTKTFSSPFLRVCIYTSLCDKSLSGSIHYARRIEISLSALVLLPGIAHKVPILFVEIASIPLYSPSVLS